MNVGLAPLPTTTLLTYLIVHLLKLWAPPAYQSKDQLRELGIESVLAGIGFGLSMFGLAMYKYERQNALRRRDVDAVFAVALPLGVALSGFYLLQNLSLLNQERSQAPHTEQRLEL